MSIAVALVLVGLLAAPLFADHLSSVDGTALPWWGWSLILAVFCFGLGIIAVLAGLGGGVLFVPIVGAIFPFHLDFVRGAGLMVAVAGSFSSLPTLLERRYADLRLGLPFAVVGSVCSIFGASLGLALPDAVVHLSLGIMILLIAALVYFGRGSDFPDRAPDSLARFLRIGGTITDDATGTAHEWTVNRTAWGLLIFVVIGFFAGLFGLGAGWANVPALNLLLGAPLKVAVGTSAIILSTNSAGLWVYLFQGALLPAVAVPAVVGMMAGTRLGSTLVARVPGRFIRLVVLCTLALAGVRSVMKGFGL